MYKLYYFTTSFFLCWHAFMCLIYLYLLALHIQCIMEYSNIKFQLDFIKYILSYCYTTKLKKKNKDPNFKKKIRAIFFKGTKKSTSSLKLQLIHIWSMLKFFMFWFETLFFSCFNCWIWHTREKVFEQLHFKKKGLTFVLMGLLRERSSIEMDSVWFWAFELNKGYFMVANMFIEILTFYLCWILLS